MMDYLFDYWWLAPFIYIAFGLLCWWVARTLLLQRDQRVKGPDARPNIRVRKA